MTFAINRIPNIQRSTNPAEEVDSKKRTPADLYVVVPESSSKRLKISTGSSSEEYDLTEFFRQFVLHNKFPELAADPIGNFTRMVIGRTLESCWMLTEDNRAIMMEHEDADNLSCAVVDLAAADLLTQVNFVAVATHSQLDILAPIISCLLRTKSLNQETLQIALEINVLDILYELTNVLEHSGILTPNRFYRVVLFDKPAGLLVCLRALALGNVLTTETFELGFEIKQLSFVGRVMLLLQKAGILTLNNLQKADTVGCYHEKILVILKLLLDANCLTEENYVIILNSRSIVCAERLLLSLVEEEITKKEIWVLAVQKPHPQFRSEALRTLSEGQLLTESNILRVFNHCNPCSCARALALLQDQTKISPELLEKIYADEEPETCATTILTLLRGSLLTEDYIAVVLQHKSPLSYAKSLVILSQNRLLNKQNCDAFFKLHDPKMVAKALKILKKAHLLTSSRVALLPKKNNPRGVAQGLSVLHEAGLLTPENEEAVCKHSYPETLTTALVKLSKFKMLNGKSRKFLSKSLYPVEHAELLIKLRETDFLTKENRKFILKFAPRECKTVTLLYNAQLLTPTLFSWFCKTNCNGFNEGILTLHRANLLTGENVAIMRTHKDPGSFADALKKLCFAAILNEENHKLASEHAHPLMLAYMLITVREGGVSEDHHPWLAEVKTDDYWYLARLMVQLHQANILTEENRELARVNKLQFRLYNGLRVLSAQNLLNEENFRMAAAHPNPNSFCKGLLFLRTQDILNAVNLSCLIAHKNPHRLAKTIHLLGISDLLSKENVERAIVHPNIQILHDVVEKIRSVSFLTQELWEHVHSNPAIENLQKVLTALHGNQILTQTTCDLALSHPRIDLLVEAIGTLGERRILTLENFILIAERLNPCDAISLIV